MEPAILPLTTDLGLSAPELRTDFTFSFHTISIPPFTDPKAIINTVVRLGAGAVLSQLLCVDSFYLLGT